MHELKKLLCLVVAGNLAMCVIGMCSQLVVWWFKRRHENVSRKRTRAKARWYSKQGKFHLESLCALEHANMTREEIDTRSNQKGRFVINSRKLFTENSKVFSFCQEFVKPMEEIRWTYIYFQSICNKRESTQDSHSPVCTWAKGFVALGKTVEFIFIDIYVDILLVNWKWPVSTLFFMIFWAVQLENKTNCQCAKKCSILVDRRGSPYH